MSPYSTSVKCIYTQYHSPSILYHKVSLPSRNRSTMMHPVLLQPSWPFYSVINSTFDQFQEYDFNMDSCVDFYPSFTMTEEDSSGISYIPEISPILTVESIEIPPYENSTEILPPTDDFSQELEEFEPILSSTIEGMYGFVEESEGSPPEELLTESEDRWSPGQSVKYSDVLVNVTEMQSLLTLPGEDMEIDNQQSIIHLLRAHGEALENKHQELAEVVLGSVNQRVNPFGETMERIAYNLSQDVNKQSDYLRQESRKNFQAAFEAFYQIFPYGKFAHFAANSAILASIPKDAKAHIVDFDICEGIQWPPIIEAIAQGHRTLRLTSIKWADDASAPSWLRFQETKLRLENHARLYGLYLKVEEKNIEDLMCEMREMKKRDGRREWLAFNCMLGLPHMRKGGRKHAIEFLNVAKELITNSPSLNRGILTFGDGDSYENLKHCLNFRSFFDGYLVHYQALLESMHSSFPLHFLEARLAMESLFVAPHISSKAWFQEWEDMKEARNLQAGTGLKGLEVSRENMMEAKELVKERDSLYSVRIGHQANEMVLEWRGTPLVKVSCWTN